jgi:RimJ/RimL family protein N-acetyltransferase
MVDDAGGAFAYEGFPLQTERLLVRSMTRADLEPYHRLNSDPEVMRFMGRAVWSREESQQVLERVMANSRNHLLDWVAIADRKAPEQMLGMVCLLRLPEAHRAEVGGGPYIEVGWRVLPEHWNRGYATEAAKAVVDYGFNVHSLNEIACIVDAGNGASLRVAQKVGLVYEKTYALNGQDIRFHLIQRTKPFSS